MQEPWSIKLFGWLRAERMGDVITRFPTQKAAALLAVLAYSPGRAFPRDVLIEMLWPAADPEAARNRFRVTLSALRRLVEPAGIEPGSVLVADRATVRLHSDAVRTDVQAFEQALAESEHASGAERRQLLERAAEFPQGELLSGFYEDWIVPERERLSVLARDTFCRLADARGDAGDLSGAIEAARRSLTLDPLCEATHQQLMSLYMAAGEPVLALRQYRDVRRTLRRALGQPPSPATRALADAIRAHLREPSTAAAIARDNPSEPTPSITSSLSASSESNMPMASHALSGAPSSHALHGPHHRLSGVPAHHLPVSLTRFFGREDELARLEGMLTGDEARLVTVTGPGGSGKTRLALEAASRLEGRFHAAVWFVPLAERHDPRLLPDAVFDAMHLRRVATLDVNQQILAAIGQEPALLVLDNFEHLAEGGAPFVRGLLERAPALRCLVTSQVRLQVDGEREVPLAPLAVPNGARAIEDLVAYPSVRLFVDRAQSVRPDFQVNDRNAEPVADICRRLEGIPLAIELAAAWAHTLTPVQMLQRLSSRFDLLVARRQDVAPRHRALRATLDWSFRLLPPDTQRFFARLAVFRNGWTLEAAQEVCDEPLALEAVASLRERSFLVAEDAGCEMRFGMLETLREYAREQLPASEFIGLVQRHAAYYMRMAEEAEVALRGPRMEETLERLEGQLDNLRAALEHSLGPDGDPEMALRLATALSGFWEFRGHFQEGRRTFARALGRSASEPVRMRALNGAARLSVCQGDAQEGSAYAEEALALARAVGDTREEALALRNMAFADYITANFQSSVERQEQSLELFRALGDTWGMAASLDDMGSVLSRTGEYLRARALLEESLHLYESLGHREGVGSALFGLGVLARDLGDAEEARRLLEQSLQIGRDMKDVLLIALALNTLGTTAAMRGNLDDARAKLTESTMLFRELRDSRGLFFALYYLAVSIERHVNADRAIECLREGLSLAQAIGDRRYMLYNLDGLAAMAADQGDTRRAALLFAKADVYREEIAHPWPPYIREERDQTIARVRADLGEETFMALQSDGAALTIDEAIRVALATASGRHKNT